MYTRNQLQFRFNPPHESPDPPLTSDQLDTLEAVQAAGAEHGRQGFYPDGDFSSDADWCNGIGELISRLETELEIDDGAVFQLYSEAHSEAFSDGTINPEDRNSNPRLPYSTSIFDFQFGAYGETKVSVHARNVEEALELAADWLAENAPGHLIKHDDKAFWADAEREARKDLGVQLELTRPGDDIPDDVLDAMTADLTHTEAGYLRSWEWYVNERT